MNNKIYIEFGEQYFGKVPFIIKMVESMSPQPCYRREGEGQISGLQGRFLWEAFADLLQGMLMDCAGYYRISGSEIQIKLNGEFNIHKSYKEYLDTMHRHAHMDSLCSYSAINNLKIFINGVNIEEVFKIIN